MQTGGSSKQSDDIITGEQTQNIHASNRHRPASIITVQQYETAYALTAVTPTNP